MKKTLKVIGIVLVAIVALALVLILTSPLWIGCVVKTVANTAVPKVARTEFSLDDFSFNMYKGRLEVSGVKLANPEGFDQEMALTLGKLYVDVDMSTVLSNPIVIEKVEVRDVFASYLDGSHGTNNIDLILANVKDSLGIEQSSEPESVEVEVKSDATKKTETAVAEEEEDEESELKIIIDDLLIDSVVVQYGAVKLPLKIPVHITGIGRDLGGLSAKNAWQEIFSQFWRSLTDIGTAIFNIGAGAVGTASETTGKAMDTTTKAADEAVKKTSEAIDKAAGALKGLFNK